ncbi:uncharacterized protein MELLADRAFT_113545 [Melampsora larici-populina 98AG31]|uniref:Uncharacterized protein n=1 Tax=Melampsora larici-populina (strain 98AG31 / pathotype 3-4-7) TaxID=747676 RepID=F4SA91_MELLP|nr:uncharacterized protein MELLADRAFT_113545 [Melampsora larici-populina 98AG31]EGF98410.1 hypothetical protein MELLADRAFT_113545 [Melampsora larici-populina 98AG31]
MANHQIQTQYTLCSTSAGANPTLWSPFLHCVMVWRTYNWDPGIVGQTMIRRHTSKALFSNLCNNIPSKYAETIGVHTLFHANRPKWTAHSISPECSQALSLLLTRLGILGYSKTESTSLWQHAGKSFTISKRHIGNSRIEFKDQGNTTFGEIVHILRVDSHPGPLFVIRPFRPLTHLDESKSPYHSYPYLKARVMYRQPLPLRVIALDDLFGHSALVENDAGAMNIPAPTVNLISLRSLGISEMASTYTDLDPKPT